MTALERHQVPIYFAAVLLGSAVGLLLPGSASALEILIWPVVGTLLYFTFLQVPLLQFRQALADVRHRSFRELYPCWIHRIYQ